MVRRSPPASHARPNGITSSTPVARVNTAPTANSAAHPQRSRFMSASAPNESARKRLSRVDLGQEHRRRPDRQVERGAQRIAACVLVGATVGARQVGDGDHREERGDQRDDDAGQRRRADRVEAERRQRPGDERHRERVAWEEGVVERDPGRMAALRRGDLVVGRRAGAGGAHRRVLVAVQRDRDVELGVPGRVALRHRALQVGMARAAAGAGPGRGPVHHSVRPLQLVSGPAPRPGSPASAPPSPARRGRPASASRSRRPAARAGRRG